MPRKELETVLDYILNKADEAEFEVIAKACERRKNDRSAFARIGGLGPNAQAHKMADNIQTQMGYSLDGIRATVKEYVADIIRKNAPEVSEEQLQELLDAYVPDPDKAAKQKKKNSPYPPEALLSMARQFVEYAEGRMAPSRQREIWEQMPRWQDEYWAAFPGEMKALIKAYLDGQIDGDTFNTALLSFLGL
jgi:hypothetical protein